MSEWTSLPWLHCSPCDVMWSKYDGEHCWSCGEQGVRTVSPIIPRTAHSLDEMTEPLGERGESSVA